MLAARVCVFGAFESPLRDLKWPYVRAVIALGSEESVSISVVIKLFTIS